jgi:hypothetical protein
MIHGPPHDAPILRLAGEYHLGRPEYTAAIWMYFQHKGVLRKRFIALLVAVSIPIGLIVWASELWRQPVALGIVCAFILGMLVLAGKVLDHATVRATLKAFGVDSAPGVCGSRRIQVTDDELLFETEVSRVACRLDVLRTVRADDTMLVLFPGGSMLPVPSSGNLQRESFAVFCDKLDQLIAAAKARRGSADRR